MNEYDDEVDEKRCALPSLNNMDDDEDDFNPYMD
jgi:hypothetical protein